MARLARLAVAVFVASTVFIGRGEAAVDGRKLTLDNGLVLMVPPTLTVDQTVLRVGTRITAR